MRLDFARLNEVMAGFRRFIKSAKGNSVSYSNIFPMLGKLMADLGALRANKHAEALMNAVSRHFSETTDVNTIFTCFLVTPIGKKCYGAVTGPSEFAASMETMWKKGVITLSKAFHYDVAQMISLFQDYLDNPRQFHSVKNLCTYWPRQVSIAGQQHDTDSFVDETNRSFSSDVTQTLLKLLSAQNEVSSHWQLAAAAVVLYIGCQSQFVGDHIQSVFDVVQSMKSPAIKSLSIIFLAELVPSHLWTALFELMRQTLFPTAFSAVHGSRNSLSSADPDGNGIPLILRIGVVRGIATVACDEQPGELSRQLEDRIFSLAVKRSRAARDPSRTRVWFRFDPLGLLASLFVTCGLPEIARLARGMAYRKRDIQGTSLPFVEISPTYHALTLEIASVVDPKSRTICLDLRISGKGVIPSAVVFFNVPENLTPGTSPNGR
jgi:hypothetical protein